ncbi:MAG: putative Histidine kinase [Candidatus Thorarchaeota archaeon]|nr:MAG: putative Histidine kinase [Candidatus Thorarchaeota archaeon]
MKHKPEISVDELRKLLNADLKSVWQAVTSLPRGIAIVNLQEEFIFVNEHMANVMGYEIEELIGNSIFDFIDTEYTQEIESQTSQRIEGNPSVYELSMTRKNGECRILRVSAAPWRNSEGEITGTVGIVDDITDEKTAKKALEVSQKRYKLLFEGAQEAITIETSDEIIIQANQAACDLFGYSRNELLGMNSRNLVAPEERTHPRHPVYQQKEGFESDVFERTIFTKEGKRIPVEISLGHLHTPEQVLFMSFLRDISERKHHEDVQKQYERELELYTSIMRHDLTSDLQIVLGYVELTLDSLPEEDNISQERLLQSLAIGKQMANLLQTFTPMKDMYDEKICLLLESIAEQSEKANANLKIEVICDEAVRGIKAPSSRLLPVAFVNLFRNAAMHAGETPTVKVHCTKVDKTLQIIVSDDGPGVDPSIRKKLFNKGVSTRGGGLGLYLTKQIIESLNGTIELQKSEGAVFKIILPI